MTDTLVLDPHTPLTLDLLVRCARDPGIELTLSPEASRRIDASHAVIIDALTSRAAVYGLTRNVGDGRDEVITDEQIAASQEQMVVSHSGAVGEPMDVVLVRAMMVARLRGFVEGFSGVSPAAVQSCLELLNRGVTPVVRRHGSVGAADLASLAAIANVMLGNGEVHHGDRIRPTGEVFEELCLAPLKLSGKDGLALISANAYSIGAGAVVLAELVDELQLLERAAALHMLATAANTSWLAERASDVRPDPSQRLIADHLRRLIAGSTIEEQSAADSLQDPLSIRSFSHLVGAVATLVDIARSRLEFELNSSGDNPISTWDTQEIIPTANFSCFEIAFHFESLSVAIAQLAIASERRLRHASRRIWAPREGELMDSVILAPYSAITARLRANATPVSIHIPPLTFGHEDSVSGAPLAIDTVRGSIALLHEMTMAEIIYSVDKTRAREIGIPGSLEKTAAAVAEAIDSTGYPRTIAAVGEALSTRFHVQPGGISAFLSPDSP